MPTQRLILVDASNVRRSAWPNLDPARLVELLDAWVDGGDAPPDVVDVVAVLDGRADVRSTDRVEVVQVAYADDELVAIAQEAVAAGLEVLAATSDRELRARLEGAGARVEWGGGRFLRMLARRGEVGDDGLEPPTPSV